MRAYEVIILVFFDSLIIQSESDCPLGALTRSFFFKLGHDGGAAAVVFYRVFGITPAPQHTSVSRPVSSLESPFSAPSVKNRSEDRCTHSRRYKLMQKM